MTGRGEAISYADTRQGVPRRRQHLVAMLEPLPGAARLPPSELDAPDWDDLDCPVARHLTEVADALAATRV